jgi:averufin monooxygenase
VSISLQPHKTLLYMLTSSSFDPSRWLSGAQSAGKGTDTFMAFGAGPRGCAGIYLARMELRIAAAMFFRECPRARLKASATPESMVVVDRFNTHPVGRRCEITL